MKLYWFLKGLRDFVPMVLSAVCGAGFGIWTSFGIDKMFSKPAVWWVIATVVVAAAFLLAREKLVKPTYRSLLRSEAAAAAELDNARASLQTTMDSLAWILLRQFKLQGPEARASIYSVEDDEFVLISRRSHNPVLERRGRLAYPLGQGAIGEAWSKGTALRESSAVTRAEWESQCVDEDGFSADEAVKLTMAARSILAVRLDTSSGERVGMLVLESEVSDVFSEKTVASLRRSPLTEAIVGLVASSHTRLPRARERQHERAGSATPVSILDEPVWKNSVQQA